MRLIIKEADKKKMRKRKKIIVVSPNSNQA